MLGAIASPQGINSKNFNPCAMEELNAVPLSISSFSLNFPETKRDEITRLHITHTIDHLLISTSHDIVFVDGFEGMGKTTLLKQFCESHIDSALSCFLNPFNIISYNEYSLIYDLYNQIQWFLNETESTEKTQIGLEHLRFAILELKKKRSKLRKTVYFVIDGLETNSNPNLTQWVFNILPLRESGFKFVITGNSKTYAEHYPLLSKVNFRDYIISPFSLEETEKFLTKDLNLQEAAVKALFNNSSNGVPGKLANLKRHLLLTNKSVDELLDSIDSLNEVFDLEWNKLKELNNPLLNEIVSFVALDTKLNSCSTLAELIGIPEVELRSAIGQFDSLYTNSRNEVQFYSQAQKTFFAKKFEAHSESVLNRIIQHYSTKNNNSVEALINVPNYLENIEKWGSVVEYLSGDYLSRIVNASESLVMISQKVTQGYQAAKKLNNDQIVKFALQCSLVENVEGLHTWKSEIEARISIGEYEKAITLAEGALLKEDRLKLILKIAKAKNKKGLPLDEGLVDLIKKLYTEIDFAGLGEKAFDLASDLFYSVPQLAIELLQNSGVSSKLDSLNEHILTKISISAFENRTGVDPDKISFLTKNQTEQSLTSSISFLIRKYDADQVLFEAEKLNDIKSKIYFCKVWIDFNNKHTSVAAVIEYALLKCQELSSFELLSPDILIGLSKPLVRVENVEVRRLLLQKLRSFEHDAKKFFPPSDYFEMELNLIMAEVSIDYNSAIGRFTKIKEDVLKITDLVTKADSLALIYTCLLNMQSSIKKQQEYLFEQILSSLKNAVKAITTITAEHYENLKKVVRTLASTAPELAFEIANKAYTLYRKENLVITGLDRYLSDTDVKIDMNLIGKFYDTLTIKYNKNFSLLLIFTSLAEKKDANKIRVTHLLKYIEDIKLMDSLTLKCKVLVSFLEILKPFDEFAGQYEMLKILLLKSWEQINSEINKIEVGFLIADDLSEYDPLLGKQFLRLSDESKNRLWMDSINTFEMYTSFAYLLIKVFSGLIKNRKFNEDHLRRVFSIIQKIPSSAQKASLYSYLAHQFINKQDLTNAEKIINEKLRPLIDSSTDVQEKFTLVNQCAELLFINNQILTIRLIEDLPYEYREPCIVSILNFLLTKQIPMEPYLDNSEVAEIEFPHISNCCGLVEKLQSDYHIYDYIETIVKIVSKGKLYSKTQRIDVSNTLSNLIAKRLPAFDGVPHDGYKIVALAQLIKLMDRDKQKAEFQKSIDRVNAIANKADQSFIYCILSEIAGSINVPPNMRGDLMKKSLDLLDQLNCDLEYVTGITNIGGVLTQSQKNLPISCKEKMKIGFKLTLSKKSDSLHYQKRLLDIAYKVDKTFAKALYNLLDDDEGRKNTREKKRLKEHIAILEAQSSINNEGKITIKDSESKVYSRACVNSLAELNSGLLVTKKPSTLWYLFDAAHKLPINESFPIYSYYFQNLVNRLESSNEAESTILPFFESLNLLCTTIETLSDKSRKKTNYQAGKGINIEGDHNNRIIRVGERELALSYLKEWLQDHLDEYIKICDPYFNTEDLHVLKTILEIQPSASVDILTSLQPFKEEYTTINLNESWLEQWRLISSQDPPHTKINVIVRKNDKKTPFHDRWIITKNAGLRIGTSINSIGMGKESEISKMAKNEKEQVENLLDQYLSFKVLSHKNEKLHYQTILLN